MFVSQGVSTFPPCSYLCFCLFLNVSPCFCSVFVFLCVSRWFYFSRVVTCVSVSVSSYLHSFFGHSKIVFFVGFPHQYKTFFCYITCTFKRTSLLLFRFKISQCIPFWVKNLQNLSKTCKKGTNCEILILNYRRHGRLKLQKKSCTNGGNSRKKFNFWVTSHLKVFFRKKIKIKK